MLVYAEGEEFSLRRTYKVYFLKLSPSHNKVNIIPQTEKREEF